MQYNGGLVKFLPSGGGIAIIYALCSCGARYENDRSFIYESMNNITWKEWLLAENATINVYKNATCFNANWLSQSSFI